MTTPASGSSEAAIVQRNGPCAKGMAARATAGLRTLDIQSGTELCNWLNSSLHSVSSKQSAPTLLSCGSIASRISSQADEQKHRAQTSSTRSRPLSRAARHVASDTLSTRPSRSRGRGELRQGFRKLPARRRCRPAASRTPAPNTAPSLPMFHCSTGDGHWSSLETLLPREQGA